MLTRSQARTLQPTCLRDGREHSQFQASIRSHQSVHQLASQRHPADTATCRAGLIGILPLDSSSSAGTARSCNLQLARGGPRGRNCPPAVERDGPRPPTPLSARLHRCPRSAEGGVSGCAGVCLGVGTDPSRQPGRCDAGCSPRGLGSNATDVSVAFGSNERDMRRIIPSQLGSNRDGCFGTRRCGRVSGGTLDRRGPDLRYLRYLRLRSKASTPTPIRVAVVSAMDSDGLGRTRAAGRACGNQVVSRSAGRGP
jgi:hypothetical protein